MKLKRIHGNSFIRILIVDDHVGFRTALCQVLRREYPHSDVIEVGTRKEALQQLAAAQPDLAFIDMRLPDGSGLDLTREIKAAHPPMVVVTLASEDVPEYRQAAAEHGASHYIFKRDMTVDAIRAPVDAALAAKAPKARARLTRARMRADKGAALPGTVKTRTGRRGRPKRT